MGIADPSPSNVRLSTLMTTISQTTGARTQADHVVTGKPCGVIEQGSLLKTMGGSQMRGALPAGIRASIPSSLPKLSALLLLIGI